MKRLLIAISVASFLSVWDVVAAQAEDPVPKPGQAAATKDRKDSDFTLGLAYHGPTRLTGSATLMWGEPRMLVAWAPAKLAQLRVGTRGAQLGLGLVGGVFEESAWKPSGLAVTIKAIVIRTWRDPAGVTNGHSYAGVESDVVLLGIRSSLGYARKVAGRGGPDGRFVWSIGLGL
jgi:hypothetical protein